MDCSICSIVLVMYLMRLHLRLLENSHTHPHWLVRDISTKSFLMATKRDSYLFQWPLQLDLPKLNLLEGGQDLPDYII